MLKNGHGIIFVLTLALTACGPFKRDNEENEATPAPPASVTARGTLYCDLSLPQWEVRAGIFGSCDAAGFASLHTLRCEGLDLSLFQEISGRMHRSTDHQQCWDYSLSRSENAARAGASKSGFSRDHVLMRMVAAWVHKDTAWVNSFAGYVKDNGGRFCDAVDDIFLAGRCVMSPTLSSLLFDMQAKMNGSLALQQSDDAVPEDFEGHLRLWFIWLSGQVRGAINDFHKKDLEALADREPENALYQAAWARYRDGNMTRVYEILDDKKHFPDDRLPTNDEHCTDYLYQRDMVKDGAPNSDWLPCAEKKVHSGTDYEAALFMATYDL